MQDPDILPIASPFGSGPSQRSIGLAPVEGSSVTYTFSSWSLNTRLKVCLRATTKELLAIPLVLPFQLVILALAAAMALLLHQPKVALFFALLLPLLSYVLVPLVLSARGRVSAVLDDKGVHERFRGQLIPLSISWKRVLWVFDWGGDVCVVTIGGGCFIPREAFASREESHEFVQIARELKQSDGAAWRDKWNGRVFGLHSDEVTGARNSPR